MVVLFVAYDVNHLVDGVVLKAEFGRTDVLRHVNAGAVGAQQEFFVKAFVGQVCPDGAVVPTVEDAFLQSLEYFFLAFEVGVAFVIYLVEVSSKPA